ncbi:MAG: TetR family transcriptional regulator [Pseudomonadota bacterium]
MARKSDKKDRLVHAAADLFWEKGFDATSLADIAKSAGIPLGNVYYYFKTKVHIARAVADLFVTQSRELVHELDRQAGSPAERLDRFIDILDTLTDARTRRGCPIARGAADFKRHDPQAAAQSADALSVLTAWLETTLREAGRSGPEARARQMITAWQGAIALSHAYGSSDHLTATLAELRSAIRTRDR